MNLSLELPSDVWRLIILICKIQDITNLCSVDKFFCSLCLEKNLWLQKFKQKNLIMINNKIDNVGQYVDEYRKVSYASYIANCLFDLVKFEKQQFENLYRSFYDRCWIYPFDITYLPKILDKNIFDLIKIEGNGHNKIFMRLEIKNKQIKYYTCEKYYENFISDTISRNNMNYPILVNDYDCKNILISIITKVLYYIPFSKITDAYQLTRIFNNQHILDWNSGASTIKGTLTGDRIKYWDECCSKYDELYF